MIVTLDEAKAHLCLDGNDLDGKVTMLLAASICHAESFCKAAWADGEAPASVKAAVLLILGDLMENPQAEINKAAKTLLWPNRMQGF